MRERVIKIVDCSITNVADDELIIGFSTDNITDRPLYFELSAEIAEGLADEIFEKLGR